MDMNRRTFTQFLASLPFIGWGLPKPAAAAAEPFTSSTWVSHEMLVCASEDGFLKLTAVSPDYCRCIFPREVLIPSRQLLVSNDSPVPLVEVAGQTVPDAPVLVSLVAQLTEPVGHGQDPWCGKQPPQAVTLTSIDGRCCGLLHLQGPLTVNWHESTLHIQGWAPFADLCRLANGETQPWAEVSAAELYRRHLFERYGAAMAAEHIIPLKLET